MPKSNSGLLRLIALFKFFKAVTLVLVGIAALRLIHGNAANALTHLVHTFGLNPGGRYVDEALGKLARMPPGKFKELGIGSFVYAALFFTEGTGLWLGKKWAEWFTAIITGSLIPLEVYEIVHHPTATKGIVLVLNIAIVIYLLFRIRDERHKPAG